MRARAAGGVVGVVGAWVGVTRHTTRPEGSLSEIKTSPISSQGNLCDLTTRETSTSKGQERADSPTPDVERPATGEGPSSADLESAQPPGRLVREGSPDCRSSTGLERACTEVGRFRGPTRAGAPTRAVGLRRRSPSLTGTRAPDFENGVRSTRGQSPSATLRTPVASRLGLRGLSNGLRIF